MAAEEKDDEEQEDVLALMRAVDARGLSRGDGGEAGETDAEPVLAQTGGGGRAAGEIELEGPERFAGETAEDGNGGTAQTLRKEGPVWPVRSVEPEIDAAQRLGEAARVLSAAQAGGGLPAGTGQVDAGAGTEELPFALERQAAQAQAGLEGLYRQSVQAARPAAPALPPERAGRTARAQEPGSTASLAVDELDRAVRRDSRRYDGGMSIF